MAQTLRPGEDTACPHARELEESRTEDLKLMMRRLATQDEIIAQLRADVAAVKCRLRDKEEQLLAFADSMSSASGFFRDQAELLADGLR